MSKDTACGWLDAFNPNIPTGITDAMSYVQQLERCYKKMRDVLCEVKKLYAKFGYYDDTIDNLYKDADSHIKAEVAKQLSPFESDINDRIDDFITANNEWADRLAKSITSWQASMQQNLTQQIQFIGADLQNLREAHNRDISGLDDKIALYGLAIEQVNSTLSKDIADTRALIANLETEFLKFKMHVDNQLAQRLKSMEDKLDAQIARANGDLLIVTDPTTGQLASLKDALNSLVDAGTPYPITYQQYNSIGITCQDYNARHIPYWQYNNWGGLVFLRDTQIKPEVDPIWESLNQAWDSISSLERAINDKAWLSPVNGQMSSLADMFAQLFNYMQDMGEAGINIARYESYNLTMADYQNKSISNNLTIERYSQHARFLL